MIRAEQFQVFFEWNVPSQNGLGNYLEDHPRTCKWLITMVNKSPKDRVVPLPNGLFMAYIWGVILTTETSPGMILQVLTMTIWWL